MLGAVLLGVVACTNLPTLTPPPTPTSTPTPTRTSITLELEVKSNPREAADIVLNPKPIPGGRYLLGRTVTINVLPKEGWQVDEWVGPVYGIAGKTAKINMTSNQTVIIRMVRFETALQSPVPVPPTPTPIPTLPTSVPPTPTSEPAPAPRPTPTLRVRAAPAPTAAPGNTAVQPIQFQFLSKWGSQGSGDGQLNFPDGIAVDEAGNVYVADRDNHRVQKFGADGRFLLTWGSEGGGDGQFNNPRAVSVDRVRNVYVVDQATAGTYGTGIRIQKFSSDGRFLLSWGTSGDGDGQFYNAEGIAVDGAGNVYVTDWGRERVQKFTSNGGFLLYLGTEGTGAGRGTGDGQFHNPKGISVDRAGNVYVAETINHRVQVFDSNGRFLRKWGSEGSGDGQFNRPTGIAIDRAGNVYVADRDNHRVQVFDSNGRFQRKWGSEGSGNGQFDRPRYVAVDGAWNVYVSDSGNHRVQVFAPVRPSPSTPVPISTPSPASTPTPGTFEELSSVEKSLVGLWFRSQAATETTNCRTRFVPTGSVYECRSESKNDGIWFYLRFNADRTGCSWEEPEARGRVRAKQSSFSDWEIEPPEHPELKLFRVEAVPRGFEYDQSIRRVWPKDLSGLIYGPSSTPKSCPE
ncbi:MAG: 6-bladed beta-propeller [Chloroflexota bacterium]|nr:6-bladed beta-propeller [Chloroflexota bacterium]